MGRNSDKRIRNSVRRSYIISTVSIALVLFILGAVSYVILSTINAAETLRERVVLSVEIKDELSNDEKRNILSQLRSFDEVDTIEYTSKEDKLLDEEFLRYFEHDIASILDENPLNDSFELTLHKESVDVAIIDNLVERLKTITGVEYISVPPIEIIDKMHTTLTTVIIALLIFLAVLLIITLLLLNNTIRLAIYAKRYLINTMKLVGATKWYIMRPFLRSALWQGVLSGVVASWMLLGIVYGTQHFIPATINLLSPTEASIIIAMMIALGIIITLLFSALAVGKYVNMKTNKIHLY